MSREPDGSVGALALQPRGPRAGGDPGSDTSADVSPLAPNILGIRHWSRLLGGLLDEAARSGRQLDRRMDELNTSTHEAG